MAKKNIKRKCLLPEYYFEDPEPLQQEPNNKSEQLQDDQNDRSTRSIIFEGSKSSDFPNNPFHTPNNLVKSVCHEGNASVNLETKRKSDCDLEGPSNAKAASSFTSHIWDLTPVPDSTQDETAEINALLGSGITHCNTYGTTMKNLTEVETNSEVQMSNRVSVIVAPNKNLKSQTSDDEKKKTRKRRKKNGQFISGLSGCDLYKCGNDPCPFTADHEQTLMNHMLACPHARKTGRVTCPHCGRFFWYRNFFLMHIEHHGKNKYFCELCTFGSPVKASLAKHMNQKHKSKKKTKPEKKAPTKRSKGRPPRTTRNPVSTNQYASGLYQALPNTNQGHSNSSQHLLNPAQYPHDPHQLPVNTYQNISVPPQTMAITNQNVYAPPQVMPNTYQRPNEYLQNPFPIPEDLHDIPYNTNQQSNTTAMGLVGETIGQPQFVRQESPNQVHDELCCPLCRERFSVKMITLYQYHLYEEVRHRRMMHMLTKAKLSHNNFIRENSPDLDSDKPIRLSEEPNNAEIMFWVNKNIKRQLHHIRQLKQKNTRA